MIVVVLVRAIEAGCFGASPQQEIGNGIEPCLVPLTRRGCELDYSFRRNDFKALSMEPRRHWVVICYDPHGLDRKVFGTPLRFARYRRSSLTPEQRSCIWMHPDIASMSAVGQLATTWFPGILPEVFSDHGLRNRLNHPRISASSLILIRQLHATGADIEALIKFRCKRREGRPVRQLTTG